MAAALALAFQSSHLQDGLAEFLTMVRGCNLIAGEEALRNPDSAFHVCGHPSVTFVSCIFLAKPALETSIANRHRPSAKMDTWRR